MKHRLSNASCRKDCRGDKVDERLARRWRRRCATNRSVTAKNISDKQIIEIEDTSDGDQEREGGMQKYCSTFLDVAVEHPVDQSVEDNDTDPQYEIFLKYLRACGKSYELHLPVDDEVCIIVRYEEEISSNTIKHKVAKNSKHVPSAEEVRNPKDVRNVPSKKGIVSPKPLENIQSRGTNTRNEKNLKFYDMDDSYDKFLSSSKYDGETLVFIGKGGKQIRYEEDDDSSSDSDILVTNEAPLREGGYTPFVASKSYVPLLPGSPVSSHSFFFREKLMDILRMPYDKKEHEHLLQEVSDRKALSGHKELRNGREKAYPLGSTSKSYLDHFTDLAKAIESVQDDRHRELNILRGFFYWLKNVSHEGAFRPWLDETCLTVLAQQ